MYIHHANLNIEKIIRQWHKFSQQSLFSVLPCIILSVQRSHSKRPILFIQNNIVIVINSISYAETLMRKIFIYTKCIFNYLNVLIIKIAELQSSNTHTWNRQSSRQQYRTFFSPIIKLKYHSRTYLQSPTKMNKNEGKNKCWSPFILIACSCLQMFL